MTEGNTFLFFEQCQDAFVLYQAFERGLLAEFPETIIKVQKTQITFSNRHVFACVSFQRVRKKEELPEPYIVITLGLSYLLESKRVAVKTEPYPGRWTTHIVIGEVEEIDEELFGWVRQAYEFANNK